MAKRFTENMKWEDSWFRKLPPKSKLFWLFIVDKCDIAGFWETDWELASFYIGEKVDESILSDFDGRLEKINGSKIWVCKFIEFQYGVLNPAVNLHKSVIKILEKQGLIMSFKKSKKGSGRVKEGLDKSCLTLKDKEKDKEIYKGKDIKEGEDCKDKKGDSKGGGKEKVVTPEVITPKQQQLSALQQVVEHYKQVCGFQDIEGWDKANFPRCAKSAKNILAMSNNDTETAKQAIEDVIKYHEEAGLSYTLETVVKKFAEWRTGKLRPRDKGERRRQGNLEAVKKFVEGG